MNNIQKIGLIFLAVVAVIYIKISFFSTEPKMEEELNQQSTEVGEETEKQEIIKPEKKKVYVNVFFIGQNDNKEEVYKALKREYYPDNQSKVQFAVKSLIKGPTAKERNLGVYTEIPLGTKIIGIVESPSKIIINLSSDFEQGGGTDSLYKRLFQLIKTAKRNTNLPVYLYLDGKQIDVVGGEGIMINQPLSEDFVNE